MLGEGDEYVPRGSRERRAGVARPRRAASAGRGGTPVVVPRRRAVKSERRTQIERGLNGDTAGTGLSRQVGRVARTCDRRQRAAARSMLFALDRQGAALLDDAAAAAGVVRLARLVGQFCRSPAGFEPTVGQAADRQLCALAEHLLARWPVPAWLADAWAVDAVGPQAWYAHVGAGRNLSTAPLLPVPLTKRMAHFAVAAAGELRPTQAVRWGQLRGLDVPAELADELVHTRLATPLPDEPFWLTVGRWFAANPDVFGHAAEVVDYLFAQRVGDFEPPPRPGFTVKGADPDRLLADARRWHDRLNRRRADAGVGPARWLSCGIAGFRPAPDAGAAAADAPARPQAWAIVELLTRDDLADEGRRLHHCVASYAGLAAEGASAIFSLRRRVDGEVVPRATVEVLPGTRSVVQARSLRNAEPDADDRRLIEAWAAQQGLTVPAFVFGRTAVARRGPRPR